jgi:hypothetical protein
VRRPDVRAEFKTSGSADSFVANEVELFYSFAFDVFDVSVNSSEPLRLKAGANSVQWRAERDE